MIPPELAHIVRVMFIGELKGLRRSSMKNRNSLRDIATLALAAQLAVCGMSSFAFARGGINWHATIPHCPAETGLGRFVDRITNRCYAIRQDKLPAGGGFPAQQKPAETIAPTAKMPPS